MTSKFYQSAGPAGLKNTARFHWKKEGELPERKNFILLVLVDCLGVDISEIYCLQRNNRGEFFDVTMDSSYSFQRLLDKCNEKEDEAPRSDYKVESLVRLNFRFITVHMHNPHVPDSALISFLNKHVDVISGVRRLRDDLGVWTAKRQVQALLRPDASGFDGFQHPPASFSIGADRGFLFYSRQPLFCRKCQGFGHPEDSCGLQRCRNCGELGHVARDCRRAKRCNLCNKEGHLYKDCPERRQSYADVAAARDECPVGREEQREEWRETVIYEVEKILSPLPDSPEREVDKEDGEEEVLEVNQDTGAESEAEEGMEWAQAVERKAKKRKKRDRIEEIDKRVLLDQGSTGGIETANRFESLSQDSGAGDKEVQLSGPEVVDSSGDLPSSGVEKESVSHSIPPSKKVAVVLEIEETPGLLGDSREGDPLRVPLPLSPNKEGIGSMPDRKSVV